jgi:2-polyprenyl-6-methoxyphenol hydroxylase-like FAD-dependent oxidoreductase
MFIRHLRKAGIFGRLSAACERFSEPSGQMREADVAIIGGGLAGSTAAAMLGRAGVSAVLIDPHTTYPPDFRCEKLDASQLKLLRKTGLADEILPFATLDGEVWIARFGRIVEKRRIEQYDLLYDTFVNAMRRAIPPCVPQFAAKALSISTGPDRQQIALSDGETISARIAVLANGLSVGLRHMLGLEREVVSACHSISIGFDVRPLGRDTFGFRAMTFYPGRPSDRMAYLTLFPIGSAMRVNFFVYREARDLWLREMRHAPRETLVATLPSLARMLGDFEVAGEVKIRPVDLYVTHGHRQAGVVVIGDAFASSCPAAGTGVNKVLTDVERLCNHHIRRWLATPGMDRAKIEAFYDDPVKQACDAHSAAKARYLHSLSTDASMRWRISRTVRFAGRLGITALRYAGDRLSTLQSVRRRAVDAGDRSL